MSNEIEKARRAGGGRLFVAALVLYLVILGIAYVMTGAGGLVLGVR